MHVVKGAARLFLATSVFAFATPAQSSEKITYVYDQFGRLTKVTRAKPAGGSTPASSVATEYAYDKADNRQKVKVTGTAGSTP